MRDNERPTCEAILRDEIAYNLDKGILPSEIAVARRLLSRTAELAEAFGEIHRKLHHHPDALRQFIGMLLSTGAFWNRDAVAQARQGREKLKQINASIEQHAQALAELLETRERLHNTCGFAGDTLHHIMDVIERANACNGFYASYLREPLTSLRTQFDAKYWPGLARCMGVIADDAARATVAATDALTEAATASSRPSMSDTVLAFLAYMEEARGDHAGALPPTFQPSDNALAAIMNVLLDAPPDQPITADYIKGRRRRAREIAALSGSVAIGS